MYSSFLPNDPNKAKLGAPKNTMNKINTASNASHKNPTKNCFGPREKLPKPIIKYETFVRKRKEHTRVHILPAAAAE